MQDLFDHLRRCELCPRRCRANRAGSKKGFCGVGGEVIISHYGPHSGEEPPISGTKGSGTIFFSSCNLRCIFCQNYQISQQTLGERYDVEGLIRIFFALERMGVHNINLVSPTPYIPFIAAAIKEAKKRGIGIPFVYNSNAYESVEALKGLTGLIDIYLPDFKYSNHRVGNLLSEAHEYPMWAKKAILEMKDQVGGLVIEDGVAKKGLLVRHLVLPNNLAGSKEALTWIARGLGTGTYLSLMSQYFPMYKASTYPMLDRRITKEEYGALLDLCAGLSLRNVFVQELTSAPNLVPDFNKDAPFEERTGTKG